MFNSKNIILFSLAIGFYLVSISLFKLALGIDEVLILWAIYMLFFPYLILKYKLYLYSFIVFPLLIRLYIYYKVGNKHIYKSILYILPINKEYGFLPFWIFNLIMIIWTTTWIIFLYPYIFYYFYKRIGLYRRIKEIV